MHGQENLKLCSFMAFLSCNHTNRLVDVIDALDIKRINYVLPSTRMFMWMHERNTTKLCTSLPEDEHLDVRNMSKTL